MLTDTSTLYENVVDTHISSITNHCHDNRILLWADRNGPASQCAKSKLRSPADTHFESSPFPSPLSKVSGQMVAFNHISYIAAAIAPT